MKRPGRWLKSQGPQLAGFPWLLGIGLLLAYVGVRILALPSDVAASPSFTHDSAYVGIVARNLLEGRGYVNDANWLLFLKPDSLPMYFHNANPLYPTLTAAVMPFAGLDAARAAAIVSILGSVLIGVGTFFLLRAFRPGYWLPTAGAAAAVLFPANWHISYALMPDALATGLVVCFLALVARARVGWHWWAAGAVLGLAWLTRSSSSLVVPPVALWMLWRRGMRGGVLGGVRIGIAALVVISPWLVHTARVRGSPFASDAGFYWLMDYHASRDGREQDQYYRSLDTPPTTGEVLRREGKEVVAFAAGGVGVTIRRAAAGLAMQSHFAAVLLVGAFIASALAVRRGGLGPETAFVVLLWVGTIAALAVRGPHAEPRYFSVGNTLLVCVLLAPFFVQLGARRRWLMAPAIAYALLVVVPQDVSTTRAMAGRDRSLEEFRASAVATASTMPAATSVISHLPYMFTYHTGRPAVSPPYPGRQDLLNVMAQYHAPVVLLPTDSVGYYYPGAPGSLAPDLRVAAQFGRFSLLRLHN
ncbi:MAG: hypothetical protein H7066_06815 [Cytophagaceae bacterium]|nr:hypothetical protein [Gemmatimonadaceae bacterium]